MTAVPDFQYDPTKHRAVATWQDCTMTGARPYRDTQGELHVDVRATLSTGALLNRKHMRLLDTWTCDKFAMDCADKPEAQLKVRQYLTMFADLFSTRWEEDTPPVPDDTAALPSTYGTPVMLTYDAVEEKPVEWLWWPYIPLNEVTLLDGDPGLGKSMLCVQAAAIISQGCYFPDQQGLLRIPSGGPADTILLSAEDSPEHTIARRLRLAGAERSRVHSLIGWEGQEGEQKHFTFQHMPVLARALQHHPATRLVVIDPIQAYLGDIDMHRANETRPLMEALQTVARTYHVAIVCVRHPAKPGQSLGKTIHRGLGSVDFIGAARCGLFAEAHPSSPETKAVLIHMKSNLERIGRTQTFTKNEGNFEWGRITRLTSQILAGSGHGPDQHAMLETFCWLEDTLAHGQPQPSKALEEKIEEEGYRPGSVKRAKRLLGIVSKKSPHADGGWTWQLPPLPVISPPTTPATSPSSSTSATSPTTTSLGKTIPCDSDTPARGEEVEKSEDGEEIEEVEVDAVVLARAHAPDISREACDGHFDTFPPDEPCLHEHVNDLDICNDCGEILPPWQEKEGTV